MNASGKRCEEREKTGVPEMDGRRPGGAGEREERIGKFDPRGRFCPCLRGAAIRARGVLRQSARRMALDARVATIAPRISRRNPFENMKRIFLWAAIAV